MQLAATLLQFAVWADVAQAGWKASHVVNASIGHSVTLPPNLKARHPEIVQWGYRRQNAESTVTLCEKLGNRSRVCLPPFDTQMEMLPDYGLRLFTAKLSDSGLYRAVVWYIWDEMIRSVVQLQVYEPVGNISILVTRVEEDKACLLQCMVKRGSGLQFVWHAADCELNSEQLHNVSNRGSYTIVSINAVDAFSPLLYRCTVSNPVSERSIEINLKQDCSTEFDMKSLPIWALVIMGIFGFILIVLLILCCFLHWCRDMRWFFRSRREWFSPPVTQYPVFGFVIPPPAENPESG
ncbi:signaling lymphocytic activation molecule-like [Hemitrygon akajei]|uniref:signaling lymphocytic activation molecule-like n=1 Tax=Hemitrygon akajei TaxID=2704970 RepID=UPI003BFA28C6